MIEQLNAYKADVTIPVYGTIADAEVYLKKDADTAIAKLKEKLMPCLNGDCILTCEVVEKYGKENAELKQKLEDVQATLKEQDNFIKEMKEAAAGIGLKWRDYDAGEDAWEDRHIGKWVKAEEYK